MALLVDTSVWSLAFRRDTPAAVPEVAELQRSLQSGELIYITGVILQELLQGFRKPKAHRQIVTHFDSLPIMVPDREDYIRSADLHNLCRSKGVQVGTIDALLAQLCIRHNLEMLSADKDFEHISELTKLKLWREKNDGSDRVLSS